MAFTPLGGTGFEIGSPEIVPDINMSSILLESTIIHSGTYSGRMYSSYSGGNAHFDWAVDIVTAELYIGIWFRPHEARYGEISVKTSDGYYVGIRHDGVYWDAYVNSAKVADGAVAHAAATWHHVELYVNIDNSGSIQTKIDGIPDLDYSGDTQPDSETAIDFVRVYQFHTGVSPSSSTSYVDDFVFGIGDWPGDIRYGPALVPDGDTADKDWTPSSGSINSAVVDELPLSDSDYVSADTAGYKDLYTLADWSPAPGDEPQFVVDWIRAKKDTAETESVDMILKSGGVESSSGSLVLSTTWQYYQRILTTNPSTGSAWTEAGIDDISLGQEYV